MSYLKSNTEGELDPNAVANREVDDEADVHDRILIVNPSDHYEVEETLNKIQALSDMVVATETLGHKESLSTGTEVPPEDYMCDMDDGLNHFEKVSEAMKKDKSENRSPGSTERAKRIRERMESCILAAFKHNMRLNPTGLLNRFVHVISTDRLQQLIA